MTSAIRARSPVDLVVHVGAHLAEEAWFYESLGASHVLWVEADPEIYRRLTKAIGQRAGGGLIHLTYCALISETDGSEMTLRRFSNDGASNSVYGLSDEYARASPTLRETGEIVTLTSQRLSTVLHQVGISPKDFTTSLLIMDIQGHEAAALRGASQDLIASFGLVCLEMSMQSVYEGGARGSEVMDWMNSCGFLAVTEIPEVHGDVLFVRRSD